MSLNDHSINLGVLPSDIVRMIIHMVPEAAESVRLISPHWNGLSLQYLSVSQRLPVIKSFCWSINSSGNHTMIITMLDKYRYYFGVAGFAECQRFEDVVTLKFQRDDKKKTLTERIFRLLNTQCSHVDLVDLSLDISLGKEEIYKNTQAMRSVVVDCLRLTGVKVFHSKADFIMDLVRTTRVRRLSIFMHNTDISTIRRDVLRDYYSNAVQHVSIMEFECESSIRDMEDMSTAQKYTLISAWNYAHFWLNELHGIQAKITNFKNFRIIVKAVQNSQIN